MAADESDKPRMTLGDYHVAASKDRQIEVLTRDNHALSVALRDAKKDAFITAAELARNRADIVRYHNGAGVAHLDLLAAELREKAEAV